ncbi:hypothetical protein B0H19DRAFT_1276144 [Mycena capillaripes]|nr:hypothetical protein B0H19DRAFT_1276144 [Mycena capillaripes]
MDIDHHDHILMVIYLNRAEAFEEDFGHQFSGYDGLNEHFKEMAAHARWAARLRRYNKNNLAAMITEAARPQTFAVWNAYPEGHNRCVDFDAKLHHYAADLLEPAVYAALPLYGFPFTIKNVYADRET